MFIKHWFNSWIKLIKLNIPYVKYRIMGYKYYYELSIAITPQQIKESKTIREISNHMSEIDIDFKIARWARRMSYRSFGFRLYAMFKDEDNAMLFKIAEGINGPLQKF